MSRKTQRKWMNLGLAVALVGLIAVVWFSQQPPKPIIHLTQLKTDQIKHIRIAHPDKPVIELAKRKGGWWLTQPVATPAAKFQVNALLSLADMPVKRQYKTAEMDLQDLELNPPDYSITLNKTKLEFGGTEPINYRRYIRVGKHVNLVIDPPSSALDDDYSDLVNSAPVPPGMLLSAIELPDFKLVRDDKTGGWDTLPKQAGKGSDAAQTLVNAWKNARAMWQKLPTDKDQPIKGDYAVLTLDGKPVRFEVVERDPQLKLLRSDINIVYTLSGALSKDLFQLKAADKEKSKHADKTAGKDTGKADAKSDIVDKVGNKIQAKHTDQSAADKQPPQD